MRYKPMIIFTAFFFSVSLPAGAHGIHHEAMEENATTEEVAKTNSLLQSKSSFSITKVYASHSPNSVRFSSCSVNHLKDDVNSHDAIKPDSTVFLAQNMGGYIIFSRNAYPRRGNLRFASFLI